MCFLLSWKNLLTHIFWCSFENLPKISCAPHCQIYSILNYLMYFCTRMLFYALFITGNSLVDSWNFIVNFPFFHFFFLQKILFQILCSQKIFPSIWVCLQNIRTNMCVFKILRQNNKFLLSGQDFWFTLCI